MPKGIMHAFYRIFKFLLNVSFNQSFSRWECLRMVLNEFLKELMKKHIKDIQWTINVCKTPRGIVRSIAS